MLLDAIEIKNYRSLEDVRLDNLKKCNVLVGRNNAGKSSVIQALFDLNTLLRSQNIDANVLTARDKKRSLEINLTFKPSIDERKEFAAVFISKDIQNRMDILDSPFLCKIQFSFKSAIGRPDLLHLRETKLLASDGKWTIVQKINGNEEVINPNHVYTNISQISIMQTDRFLESSSLDVDTTSHKSNTEVQYNTLLNVAYNDSAIKWLYARLGQYFTDAFFFNPYRHSTPVVGVIQTEALAQDGSNLAQVLHTLRANDSDTYEKIEHFVHGALPDLGRMQTPLIGQQTNINFRSIDRTYAVPLTDMGGGIEQLLMIATVILMPRTQSHTLFLEEPESHLHAGAQRYLIEKLYEGERQIFITTHSPTFINISKPFNLYQVINTSGKTSITRADTASMNAVFEDIGVRNSDVLLSDAILFVEGTGDKTVLNTFSETLNVSLAERNINIFTMNGARDIQRAAPIRSDLLKDISGKSPVPHMFLIDRDERRETDILALETRLGSTIHVFKARELENYLLVPRAILTALKAKHRDDETLVHALANVTEDQITQLIHNAANDLYGAVLIKRIRTEIGGLREGLLPDTIIATLIPQAYNPQLPTLVLNEVRVRVEQHIADLTIEKLVIAEKEKLDSAWTDTERRLQLAPGEEILQDVFSSLGSTYYKDADTPRIAREIHTNEISEEIIEVIQKIRSLTTL